MIAAGCEPWFRAEELSVMGLAEVLPHLPRLLRIRRELVERIRALPAHVFVGIDAPDFNLPLAKRLKRAGIPDRPVREPASVGVAPGSREDDPRLGRPRALRAAVRDEVLRRARRRGEVHRSSACRCDSAHGRPRGGAARARAAGSRRPFSRSCPEAVAPRSAVSRSASWNPRHGCSALALASKSPSRSRASRSASSSAR